MASIAVMPQRLVLIGSVLVDVLLYVDVTPEPGGEATALRRLVTSGGGFNVMAAAHRLGMDVAYAGHVGRGPFGEQAAADLALEDIPLLLPRSDDDTGFDVGIVDRGGRTTYFTAPGCESRITAENLAMLTIRSGDAVYVSGYDLLYEVSGPALSSWLPQLREDRLLALDPGPLAAQIPATRLAPVLARTDILSLNRTEAEVLTGRREPQDAIPLLLGRTAERAWVTVRDAGRGCWVGSRDFEPIYIPPRLAVAVDSTGAGDAHVGAMLARLAVGRTVPEAAWEANIAASIAVERPGPATAPTAAELDAAIMSTERPILS